MLQHLPRAAAVALWADKADVGMVVGVERTFPHIAPQGDFVHHQGVQERKCVSQINALQTAMYSRRCHLLVEPFPINRQWLHGPHHDRIVVRAPQGGVGKDVLKGAHDGLVVVWRQAVKGQPLSHDPIGAQVCPAQLVKFLGVEYPAIGARRMGGVAGDDLVGVAAGEEKIAAVVDN